MLGLVSTKVGEVESADAIAARIDEAAHYLPLDQLALSAQCGFASMADGNLLSTDEQWRKMDLVAIDSRGLRGVPIPTRRADSPH